jgi:glycosyltransferase involved in cell wall biosynthesis
MCQQLPFVLVVDDGSTDDTAGLAQNARAVVVSHGRNLGKGAALRTGLSQALKRGFVWAITLDGDGQHAPEDLSAFRHCAEQTGALLVVGNRMREARSMPWLRRQVNRWMSRQLSRRAGRRLPDTQCGFRLIHLKTWATLPLKTKHFEVESETLMAFLAAGQPVEFVPIRVIRNRRRSRIQPLADSVRWWKWWQTWTWSSRPGPTLTGKDRGPDLLAWIPNVLAGRVNVPESPARLDPRQAVGKGVGFVELGVDHKFAGLVHEPPVFCLTRRGQIT